MRKRYLAGILGMCAAVICTGCSQPQDASANETPSVRVMTMQLDVGLAPDLQEMATLFADDVARVSGGHLMIQIVPGLPDAPAVQEGRTDIALLTTPQMAEADRVFSMFSLPFLYDSNRHMNVALNSEPMREQLEKVLEGKGIFPLLALYDGSAHLVTSGKELWAPADFVETSVALRSDSAEKIAVFEAMGANVLPYSQESVVSMLGQEMEILPEDWRDADKEVVVDAVEVAAGQEEELYQQTQAITFVSSYHSISPLWLVMGRELQEGLSAWERAVLQEGCAGLAARFDDARTAAEQQLRDGVAAHGFNVIEIERDSICAWLYEENEKNTTYMPPDYFNPYFYRIIQDYGA